MAPSAIHILIVILLIVVLFGRGKISELMGDVAKGIKSFKKGLSDEDTPRDAAREATLRLEREDELRERERERRTVDDRL